MKLKMYTVFDVQAEAYLPPFYMRSRGEALRSWAATVNDPASSFCKHPGDFTLFEIGEFDDLAGSVNMFDAKINLGTALEHQTTTRAPIQLARKNEEIIQ